MLFELVKTEGEEEIRMKKWNMILCAALASVSMISCGNAKGTDSKIATLQSAAETSSTKSEEQSAMAESSEESQKQETESAESLSGKSTAQTSSAVSENQKETETDSSGKLDQLALSSLSELLSQNSYNGFLCSNYSDVRQANLYQVFYNGAGMEHGVSAEAEKQDFLKQSGASELMTDLLRLTTDQMNTYLQKMTGYSFQNFKDAGNTSMTWVYLKQYDAYYMEIGDTNLQKIKLLDGDRLADGTYEVHCMEDADQDGTLERATLKFQVQGSLQDLVSGGTGAGIHFISNQADEETASDQKIIPMSEQMVAGFKTDADTSVIDSYKKKYTDKGDYSDILSDPSRFYGLWYDPSMKETLYLTDKSAQVYIPWLGNYGEKSYKWEIIDRTARKKSPELAIYFNGEGSGPLAYYLGGVTENLFWNYDKSQIFYRQSIPSK